MAPIAKFLVAAGALACSLAPSFAGEADFSSKTVTIMVGNAPGGTYDLIGRLVARHLGNHLPGHPTIIADNMPGAARCARPIMSPTSRRRTALRSASSVKRSRSSRPCAIPRCSSMRRN